MSVCAPCAFSPIEAKKGLRDPLNRLGIPLPDGWESPCEYWDSEPSSRKGSQCPLPAQSSLQLSCVFFRC